MGGYRQGPHKWSVAAHSVRVELRGGKYRSPRCNFHREAAQMSNRNVNVSLQLLVWHKSGLDGIKCSVRKCIKYQNVKCKGLHPPNLGFFFPFPFLVRLTCAVLLPDNFCTLCTVVRHKCWTATSWPPDLRFFPQDQDNVLYVSQQCVLIRM